jgi:hypothetical protein
LADAAETCDSPKTWMLLRSTGNVLLSHAAAAAVAVPAVATSTSSATVTGVAIFTASLSVCLARVQ